MPLDLEDNLERAIRETSVAALSSSPSRKNSTVFSLESHDDDETSTVTPPSSPPPQLQLTPPNVKPRKPTFSILEKEKKRKEKAKQQTLKRKADALTAPRRDESEPLSEIVNCSRAPPPAPETTSSSFMGINTIYSRVPDATDETVASVPEELPAAQPPAQKQNLIQSVLDFGQSLQPVSCAQCGMTYAPTVADDKNLHDLWHNRHSAGIELGKPFLKSAMKWCYEVPNIPGAVVVVDRKISLPGRRIVQKVLEVVNKELGSVDITEDDLWSQRPLPGEDEGKKCDRFKAFLHVINGKCVGVCLAERINKAFKVLPESDERAEPMPLSVIPESKDVDMIDNDATPRANQVSSANSDSMPASMPSPPMSSAPSSSISISQSPVSAVVGVSRIWTSQAFRRKGIANNLLECVMNQFIYGMEIERTEIAFSQPTESGTGLARGWFGEDSGWCVYTED